MKIRKKCLRINYFVENILKIKSFSQKVALLFLLIFFISLILSSLILFFYKYKKEENFIIKGIDLATSIRHQLSQEKLYIYIKNINPDRKDKYLIDILESSPSIIQNKNFKFYYKDKKIYYPFQHNNKTYIAIIDESLFSDVFHSRYGIVSLYDPYFFITDNLSLPNDSFCSYKQYSESNFYLVGCVKKVTVSKVAFYESLVISIIFSSAFFFMVLIMYPFTKKLILFPLTYIKLKLDELGERGVDRVRFGLHFFGNDEIALISKKFEEFRLKISNYQKKLELLFQTITKMLSKTNNIKNFSSFILNRLDNIFNLKGCYIVYKNNEEINTFSERYLENKNNLSNLKHIIIEKKIDERSSIEFHGFCEKDLLSEDLNYIDIILTNLGSVISIYKMATYDYLTQMLNRPKILEYIQKEIEKSKNLNKTFLILMIDLDDFKKINDRYGHDIGDLLLVSVSKLIKENLKETDIIGRYGEDEFIIILPETNKEEALIVAENIRNILINENFQINNKLRLSISASIAIVEFPTHGEDIKSLLKSADISLYKAKKEGKNKVVCLEKEEIENIIKQEFEEKEKLLKAIKEDRFVPFFQPIIDVKTNEIFGYEVLARIYNKENNTYIPAFRFIHEAIKYGFIHEIDNIIYNKALAYFSEKNIDKYIFLNLSKNFIHDLESLDNLYSTCQKYKINPNKIVLEITEEEAILDFEAVKNNIRYGKSLGFNFAIDDFGAGYSNFNYLKQFPVDMIKLDGSLVKNIDKNKYDQVIIKAIIEIAKHKNIKVLAEMVEGEEFIILKELGVDYVQGYLFSKPLKDII